MKKKIIYFIFCICIVTNANATKRTYLICYNLIQNKNKFSIFLSDINKKFISDWDLFKIALTKIESNHNPNAIGTKNDVGLYQLTPTYVKDVNRICAKKQRIAGVKKIIYNKFKLKDRFSPEKSEIMFEIYQTYYNPEHSILKAIKLHNPNTNEMYSQKILNLLLKLTINQS